LVKPQNLFLILAIASCLGCDQADREASKRMTPEYDQKTGRLRLLKYDSNGDGKVDMISTMDGARVVKIEIDQNFDGTPDRWEYYDANQKLEKVGISRLNDGKEDAWMQMDANGAITRIDISLKRDGTIQRVEHYNAGKLATAEEDTDGDGKPDKWETYDGDRLAIVAFDTTRRGTPDRRLIYAADGTAKIELDPTGDGKWTSR